MRGAGVMQGRLDLPLSGPLPDLNPPAPCGLRLLPERAQDQAADPSADMQITQRGLEPPLMDGQAGAAGCVDAPGNLPVNFPGRGMLRGPDFSAPERARKAAMVAALIAGEVAGFDRGARLRGYFEGERWLIVALPRDLGVAV